MIAGWEREDPSRVSSMLTALGNVVASHLDDRTLYDFAANVRRGPPEVPSDVPAGNHPDIPSSGGPNAPAHGSPSGDGSVAPAAS